MRQVGISNDYSEIDKKKEAINLTQKQAIGDLEKQ
jgi:hypothetical protein